MTGQLTKQFEIVKKFKTSPTQNMIFHLISMFAHNSVMTDSENI